MPPAPAAARHTPLVPAASSPHRRLRRLRFPGCGRLPTPETHRSSPRGPPSLPCGCHGHRTDHRYLRRYAGAAGLPRMAPIGGEGATLHMPLRYAEGRQDADPARDLETPAFERTICGAHPPVDHADFCRTRHKLHGTGIVRDRPTLACGHRRAQAPAAFQACSRLPCGRRPVASSGSRSTSAADGGARQRLPSPECGAAPSRTYALLADLHAGPLGQSSPSAVDAAH